MSKMVCRYLSRKYVLQDENYLEQIIDSHEKRKANLIDTSHNQIHNDY